MSTAGVGRWLVTIVAAALASAAALAHPHAWIDLRTSVVLDAEGRVVALEQEWLLDPLYSAVLMEDLGTTSEALESHAADMLDRLQSWSYFTEIRVDGAVQTPSKVEQFSAEIREKRYWFRFVLPLEAPVDPKRQALAYAVFDPTYYIEILHLENDVIGFIGSDTGRCEAMLTRPAPTTEALVRAQSADLDTTPDKSLGALFAERVAVSCP